MLFGTYTRLRIVDSTDAEYVRQLRNSPAVMRYFQLRHYISDMQQRAFVNSLADSPTQIYFIAETLPTLSPFGVYSVRRLDHRNQRGENGYFLDEEAAPTGIEAYEAAFLLLQYEFGYLNLHKVVAEVLAENKRGLRFGEGLGMKVEGVRRRHLFYEGAFHDLVEMALFRDDFYACPTPVIREFLSRKGGRE